MGEGAEENYCRLGEWNAGLHTIMAFIEQEMCINFAQLYLRNG